MASIYTNTTSLQNAFHIEFNKPLDDRMSHESVESFLINKNNPTACPLYKKAYVGMQVSVLNADRTEGLLYVCKDATPYIFQGAGKPGAADVTAETIGNYWTLMSGGEYKLVKASTATSGMLATYKMQYKAPGQNTFSDIVGAASIDIPKDYLLKEVHLCKASLSGGVYTETSKQDDANWNNDKNSVYIHFIWYTKDSGSDKTSETYLRVSDVINVDVTQINTHINSSIEEVNRHINASVNAINTRIDSSLATLNSAIDASWVAINRHIDSSYVSLNSSMGQVTQYVDSSIKTMSAHIEQYDAVHAAAFNDLDKRVIKIDSSVKSIDASVKETDLVYANGLTDLQKKITALEARIAVLESASTTV